jgi:MFS family permease
VFLGFYLSPTYLYLIPLQFALGISWSMSYVGTLRTLMERFREKATATGLLGSVLSMAGIAGPFLAPEVLSLTGGYRGIMAVSAALSLLAALTYGLYEFGKKSDEARLAAD